MKTTKKLKVRPKTWLSWDYFFHEGTRQVAILSANGFRRNAKARIGEMEYDVAREGAFSGKFFIKSGDSLLAAAERKEPHSTFVYNYVRRCSVYIQAHFVLERLVGLFEKGKEVRSIAGESLFFKDDNSQVSHQLYAAFGCISVLAGPSFAATPVPDAALRRTIHCQFVRPKSSHLMTAVTSTGLNQM